MSNRSYRSLIEIGQQAQGPLQRIQQQLEQLLQLQQALQQILPLSQKKRLPSGWIKRLYSVDHREQPSLGH
jgi:hypothetical protein